MHKQLEKHCYQCHNHKKIKGKFNIEDMVQKSSLFKNPDKTQMMIDALSDHDMPPEDEKQPTQKERQQLIQFLEKGLEQKLNQNQLLKTIPIRRLTRYEYNNFVRDLFDLKGEVFSLYEKIIIDKSNYWNPSKMKFPKSMSLGNRAIGRHNLEAPPFSGVLPYPVDHRAEHGFNNRGDQLSTSPLLLEKCFELASSIVRHPDFKKQCNNKDKLFPKDEKDEQFKTRLRQFMQRAWRKEVNEDELTRYFQIWKKVKGSKNQNEAYLSIYTAILSSPNFLYISEVSAKGIEKLSPIELSNRLSMFLWSSIPDQELYSTALNKKLFKNEHLTHQVNRMMKNKKIKALSENFALQWLQLDRLISSFPDRKKFSAYYFNNKKYRIGTHMMIEPLLLFECIMIEDQPIHHFLDHNESYLSSVLEDWYEKKAGNYSSKKLSQDVAKTFTFKRTKLKSRKRGGLLTSAAILTMNSGTERSSPILRGAWVANTIFNDPPPPPPANVPGLENEKEKLAKGMSLREQLQAHLENESCRSCHSRIDPLGFALENYNAIGQWRDKYEHNVDIDNNGVLFGQTEFKSISGFKDALILHKDRFAKAFIEKMLSYALGRSLNSYDNPHVEKILREVKKQNYKFSSVIHGIVYSFPFQHKSSTLKISQK